MFKTQLIQTDSTIVYSMNNEKWTMKWTNKFPNFQEDEKKKTTTNESMFRFDFNIALKVLNIIVYPISFGSVVTESTVSVAIQLN